MHRINGDTRSYYHKRHRIKRLSSSVIGPDGAYPWLVCPDRQGELWYARLLSDACKAIDLEVER